MPTVFETTDMDVASATLSLGYGSVRLSSHDRTASLAMVHREITGISLDHIDYQMTFDAKAPPTGTLPVCHALAGNITYEGPRGTRHHVAGEVFLAGRPDDPIRASVTSNLTVEVANIDVSLLDEVAQTAAGAADRVRLLDYTPVSRAAATRWYRSYVGVRELIDDVDVGLENTLYLSSLARFLATATLLTFPHTGVTDPDATDRHDARPTTLRRAISFIEDNVDQDISPADIAEAAGVTIRALQLTFRRHLDTTPMYYMRRVRLDAAREDLAVADPTSTTVATVAARWGFHNLGRFAGSYRAQFGELPSQTLRR